MYYRPHVDDSQYTYPLDFCPIYNSDTQEIVHIDVPPVRRPLNKAPPNNYHAAAVEAEGGYRTDLKPIDVSNYAFLFTALFWGTWRYCRSTTYVVAIAPRKASHFFNAKFMYASKTFGGRLLDGPRANNYFVICPEDYVTNFAPPSGNSTRGCVFHHGWQVCQLGKLETPYRFQLPRRLGAFEHHLQRSRQRERYLLATFACGDGRALRKPRTSSSAKACV